MKTREHTTSFIEGRDRIHAPAKTHIQVQRAQRRRVFSQQRQGVVVAGKQGQHVRAVVKGHRKDLLQPRLQGLDLRGQSGLRLSLGPQQLLAKGAQARGLATLPHHQASTEFGLPAFEFAPGMAIRLPQPPRRARDRALVAHGLQQIQQRVMDGAARRLTAQGVGKLDLSHGPSIGHGRRRLMYPAS